MTMTMYRKKLIEVALPLAAINEAAAREKSIRHGHPSTMHLWWARRPLAAARAVLFAQLVDDPSAWPELFPTEEAQEEERQRLFRIIEDFVPWEASTDEDIINTARLEIARSWARSHPSPLAARILSGDTSPAEVNAYLATELPPVHDPFAGGGTIPLEAQRLGLRAIATDLNPVAVLINKALIELPPRFAGMPPVNPRSRPKAELHAWKGAQGLAEDVRYYGEWMREEAKKRIGQLYPDVELTPELVKDRPELKDLEGKKLTVIAWLWARSVTSPDPAFGGVHVPLVSSFWLSTKEGRKTWVEPVIEPGGRSYHFEIRTGTPTDEAAIDTGTKLGRGANFRCILSGTPIEPAYIKAEAVAGRMSARLMAVVAEGPRRRVYLPPTAEMVAVALSARPEWEPDGEMPVNPRWFSPPDYGMRRYADIFTPRQLVALTTLSELVSHVRRQATADAQASGLFADGAARSKNERSASAYGDAVGVYCAFAVSKLANYSTQICTWHSGVKYETVTSTFGRQALPMTWDYAEANVFSDSSGNFGMQCSSIAANLEALRLPVAPGEATAADATRSTISNSIVSTDPPYFDNIGYADLSDFFYIWLRRTLNTVFPEISRTLLTPKNDELIAAPYRHGGEEAAEAFFASGMERALGQVAQGLPADSATTIFYAFRQTESEGEARSATGWDAFLEGLMKAGLGVVGTWPVRTELTGNLKKTVNALASSVVLVCRKRAPGASTITRGDFRRALRSELPAALKALQHGNIAPVDVAQASIGPGMAIFSRYAKVLEADGSAMTVRSALQLINEALDEYLSAQEGEADPGTRFAVTWFEANAWAAGRFGDAETLAKARNVSVAGIAEAGVLHSAAGRVRLLKRGELPVDWKPSEDDRLIVWEATQHLIKRIEEQGELAAAGLLKELGPVAEHARDLAYRLYSICERKGWADDARAYNGLVIAWPELVKLAASAAPVSDAGQLGLGLGGSGMAPGKTRKPRSGSRGRGS